jgi:hypothetical protein
MSNAIKDKKTMEKQVRKYLVAKEILDDLLSKQYSDEVWSELNSCKEKVSNLESVYFDFNNNMVLKVQKKDIPIEIESKSRFNFLNEQSGKLLDFLIRNPEIRELDCRYQFFFSTDYQSKQKKYLAPKDAKKLFVGLISNTMSSLRKGKVPIFECLHESKSNIWEIQEGKLLYFSNIQEANNYYIQASTQFDQKEYGCAFNNAKKAFEKDKKNIDACFLLIDILLFEGVDINRKTLNSFQRRIYRILLDERERYKYFIAQVEIYKHESTEDAFDEHMLVSEFIEKLAQIRESVDKLESKIVKDSLNIPGKKIFKLTVEQELKSLKDKILGSAKINKNGLIDLLTAPIITEILKEIAISLFGNRTGQQGLEETVKHFRLTLASDYFEGNFEIHDISIIYSKTKKYIKEVLINHETLMHKLRNISPKVVPKEKNKSKNEIIKSLKKT